MKKDSGFEEEVLKAVPRTHKKDIQYHPCYLQYLVQMYRNYEPDYVIKTKSGKEIYIECKGWFRPADRKKMVFVKNSHPELDIRFVFQYDNYLTSKKKRTGKRDAMTYTKWATKNGFPYAVGKIPLDWFKE